MHENYDCHENCGKCRQSFEELMRGMIAREVVALPAEEKDETA